MSSGELSLIYSYNLCAYGGRINRNKVGEGSGVKWGRRSELAEEMEYHKKCFQESQ